MQERHAAYHDSRVGCLSGEVDAILPSCVSPVVQHIRRHVMQPSVKRTQGLCGHEPVLQNVLQNRMEEPTKFGKIENRQQHCRFEEQCPKILLPRQLRREKLVHVTLNLPTYGTEG